MNGEPNICNDCQMDENNFYWDEDEAEWIYRCPECPYNSYLEDDY